MKRFVECSINLLFISTASAQFVLYPYTSADGSSQNPVGSIEGFGTDVAISDACGAALNATINCDSVIQGLAAVSYYGSMKVAGPSVCTTSCASSLASYHANVATSCGEVSIFDGAMNSWKGDIMWSFYNMSCQTDPSSGMYCPDFLRTQISIPGESGLLNLPADVLCTSCQLGLWQSMQSSAFSGYDDYAASTWAAIQQKCGLSFPIAPLPSGLNLTLPNIANSTSSASATCLSGKFYNVSSANTCQSIALANSVNSGSLKIINGLFPDCSNLVIGQSLCLPQTCETYIMQSNDTCYSVAATNNVPYASFMAYNPSFNSDCSNTDLVGTVVCLTPPSAIYTPTTIAGAVPTQTAVYANAIVPPPGNIPLKTTLNCGSWYPVQAGDYCAIISLTNGIPLDLLLAINPSIDRGCDNLIPGLYYCIQPTSDWNSTISNGTSTAVLEPPPGPTPVNTTNICFNWHKIVAKDTCSLLEEVYGVTSTDLITWNPSLNFDCLNLMLDEYYCVEGQPVPSTTISATNTPSSTTISSTSTSSTSSTPPFTPSCATNYTVVPGDTCFRIWTQFNITEAQLLAWNPSLNANCDIQAGQVLCVGVISAGQAVVPTAAGTSSIASSASTSTGTNGLIKRETSENTSDGGERVGSNCMAKSVVLSIIFMIARMG